MACSLHYHLQLKKPGKLWEIQTSIHLEDFLHTPANYENSKINENWKVLKQIRKVITGAPRKKES